MATPDQQAREYCLSEMKLVLTREQALREWYLCCLLRMQGSSAHLPFVAPREPDGRCTVQRQ